MPRKIPNRLMPNFGANGGGDEPPNETQRLFLKYKDNSKPFTSIAYDRICRSDAIRGIVAKRIMESLKKNPIWEKSVVDDLETIMGLATDDTSDVYLSARVIAREIPVLVGGKSFEDWKKTIIVSGGRVTRLEFGRR